MYLRKLLPILLPVFLIALTACHHKDDSNSDDVTSPVTTYGNADLSGMWFFYLTNPSDMIYIVFNGGGMITDFSGFNPAIPRGTYSVQATGDFNFTLRTTSGDIGPFTGKINADKVTTTIGTTGTESMKKITSFSSLEGTWTGTLSETQGASYNVTITVDSSGSITALTGFSGFQEGKIGVDPDNKVIAFWRATTGDAYNQVKIKGTLSNSQITGTYGVDSTSNPGGTVSLAKQ